MKINLKNKIMLAVFAGNMLYMGQALAVASGWYGTTVGFVDTKPSPAITTGVDLIITDSTQVNGNNVTAPFEIFGGYTSGSEDVKNNSITFNTTSATTIRAKIYGGYSQDGNVANNTVTISNGTFNSGIYGGRINNSNATTTARGNAVIIDNGTFGGSIYAGFGGVGGAVENSLTINNGTFNTIVYGGDATNGGVAKKNTVTINDGTFTNKNVYGGVSSGGGDATENEVIIKGGTFTGTTIIAGNTMGDSSGNATGNTVTIKGGTFNNIEKLNGGRVANTGNATGNTVNIEGGTFNTIKNLYGGYVAATCTSSNNTLNLKIKLGGTSTEVGYFQTMNFTLPAGTQAGETIIKTGKLYVDKNGGTATVNVKAANGVKLNVGDVITLVDSGDTSDTFTGGDILGGAAEFYYETDAGEDLNGDGDQYDLVITLLKDFISGGGDDQQKAPVEGIAATVAMINQSADLASGEGMQNLLKNTGNFDKTETNYNIDTFGAVTGTRTKYKTGSHVDMDGWGFLVGVGTTKKWTHAGKTTYGVFFEYGKGDFDTYNNTIHGEGESVNRGAGLMARQTLNNNTYYEGNIRYGKQKTDWSETEIGGYNTDSKYYGITMGIGHIYPVNNGWNEIDIYGRYTYGHVGGSDATVGDKEYHFDAVKSNRVRVGGKYNFNVNKGKETVKPYVGLAWEHEFSGECKAGISDIGSAPAPKLKGHTGIVEAGINWEANKNVQLGLGAEAYLGKRKGWSGMVNMLFSF
ncbi:MAG: autotransporter domain-containing protein [Phascolarctobacterium sp.]|nr:autotransporter domain-containing protein [Candidatus Phascolarctobacterium caballi]